MEKKGHSGKIFVIFLLLVAATGGGMTWWNYSQNIFSTRDAVLFPPVQPSDSIAVERSSIPSLPANRSLQAELAEAEMELRILQSSMQSARQAIEEAIVMVQEQKENFDFAHDRYEKLMPLVETGALEPLAASQIQSAYISARASFAQAKYLLSQAQRDYGTAESRTWRFAAVQKRVEQLRQASGEIVLEEEDVQVGDLPDPPAADEGWRMEAVFSGELAGQKILPGMAARVTASLSGTSPFSARVIGIEPIPNSLSAPAILVRLQAEPPFSMPQGLQALACQVTIDTTVPVPEEQQ